MTIHWISNPHALTLVQQCSAADDLWVFSGDALRHVLQHGHIDFNRAHVPHCLSQDCAELERAVPNDWVVWQDEDFIELIANHAEGVIQW